MKHWGTMIQLSAESTTSASNDTLNAAPATKQLAYSFVAEETVLSMFWIRVGSVAGTDGLRKVTFELQADSAGKPSDTALATYEVTGGWSVAQLAISPSWTGVTLTLGARYWIVCKNTAVAPTVDFVGFAKSGYVYPAGYSGNYNAIMSQFIKREFNGTNWTTSILSATTALTVKFSSGALFGCPTSGAIGYDASWLANSTTQVGAEFQIPASSAPLNIAAVGLSFINASSVLLYAYRNRSQVAVSPYAADTPSSGTRQLIAPLAFTAYPGDWIAILSGTTAAASVQASGQNITNHADFLGMKQWKNRAVKLANGTTWTELETRSIAVNIYLDSDSPFGSLPLNRRKFTNQR